MLELILALLALSILSAIITPFLTILYFAWPFIWFMMKFSFKCTMAIVLFVFLIRTF